MIKLKTKINGTLGCASPMSKMVALLKVTSGTKVFFATK